MRVQSELRERMMQRIVEALNVMTMTVSNDVRDLEAGGDEIVGAVVSSTGRC